MNISYKVKERECERLIIILVINDNGDITEKEIDLSGNFGGTALWGVTATIEALNSLVKPDHTKNTVG